MKSRISLLAVLALVSASQAAFLAIDYGSEWTKASLMKPGRQIDVLLDTDSKRKFRSAVAWNKDDRIFGVDAFNLAARFPHDSFHSLKYLQGNLCSGSSPYYSEIAGAKAVEDPGRRTCSLERPDGTQWRVEELVAMQISYIKTLAEKEAGERITEAVVTVPAFYTQFERQALLDALDIAGIKSKALISDGLAVAVNFAVSRTFSEREHHIIYDAGASSITATLVSFYTHAVPDAGKVLKSSSLNTTFIQVKALGFDTVASGTELDRRLRDDLLRRFEKQHPRSSLVGNHRAMARLWKEAQRVKAVLSANADCLIRVESLVDDIDFKATIRRSEFEKLTSDLSPRFSRPILDALAAANMTADDITSVILAGGASRIPMVRTALKGVIGEKLSPSVNADEAAVLGAAFYGATTKSTWRTKPMRVQDLGGYDIQLKYTKEDAARHLVLPLFGTRSILGASHAKKLTFPRRTKDFGLTLSYALPGRTDIPQDILSIELVGVHAAVTNLTRQGIEAPQVQVTFAYSDSGMISVETAQAIGELKRVIEAPVPSSSAQTTPTTSNDASSTTAISLAPSPTTTTITETVTSPIKLDIVPLSILPLTAKEKEKSNSRLSAIIAAETSKALREEAYNNLEGYLYRLRDLLDGEDTTPFKEFVQPEEQRKLLAGMEDALDWLHSKSDSADSAAFRKRRKDLEAIEQPVIERYKESRAGPSALADLQKAHALARAFLNEARYNQTATEGVEDPQRFTEDELVKVEKSLAETEAWLKEMLAKQTTLAKRDDPVLKASDMEIRGVALQKLVQGLEKRKIRKPPPPVTTSAPKESASTAPEGTESPPDSKPDRTEL